MKIWQKLKKAPEELFEIKEISPLLIQLLYNRGFDNVSVMKSFLSLELEREKTLSFDKNSQSGFYNPFLFRDMERAVNIIIDNIKKKNKIQKRISDINLLINTLADI